MHTLKKVIVIIFYLMPSFVIAQTSIAIGLQKK